MNLNSHTAIVEYFLVGDEIIIFTITKDRTNVHKIPVESHFHDITESLIRSIKKLNYDEFCNSSHILYSLLIEPIRDKLKSCTKLIVIPHGILYKIPFETLISMIPVEDNADYLINHFDISYHYSATLYQTTASKTNEKNKPDQQAFCGFAPVFGDHTENKMAAQINRSYAVPEWSDSTIRFLLLDGKRMRELSYSENEVQQIVTLYQKNKQFATGYFHEEASESTFKKTIGKYKNIHIATHSIMNESDPKRSAIIFAQTQDGTREDGILYSEETYNLDLNADLIVLSSCESGMGKLVKGEGLMALTRGFLYSGTDNLVVSLWKVSDKHTSELMIAFYENIINGDDYATSLRKAKLKMLHNEKTAFPKSWAGFILIGK